MLFSCQTETNRVPSHRRAVQELVATTGLPLNGTDVGGLPLASVVISSLRVDDVYLSDIRLNGTLFTARAGKVGLSGRDLVGGFLQGYLTNGRPVRLRIDAVSGEPVAGGVYHYAISYQTHSGWAPLCGTPNQSVAIGGVWDYREGVAGGGARIPSADLATFSCRTGTVARCLEAGYQPWRKVPAGGASADDYLQACVRMMRADYCGDGTSWTVEGILVNHYDTAGIHVDTQSWAAEAEWTKDGAICVSSQRVTIADRPAPPCALPRPAPRGDCLDRDHFNTGTLIMSEIIAPVSR